MMNYWLVHYQQRYHNRPDWQTSNAVVKGCCGKWFIGVKERSDYQAESEFLSATPITKASYDILKDTL